MESPLPRSPSGCRRLDPVERAAREARALDGVPRGLLLADVDVHLAGCRIVEPDHDRLHARVRMGDGVLPAELAERGQLVARPVQEMGEGASLGADLLAAHEQAPVVALAGSRVVERGARGQIRGAHASQRDARGWGVVRGRARVPGRDLPDQIPGAHDGEVALADRPPRVEGALGPVRTHGADGAAELMVHEHRERPSPLSKAPRPSGIPTMRYERRPPSAPSRRR